MKRGKESAYFSEVVHVPSVRTRRLLNLSGLVRRNSFVFKEIVRSLTEKTVSEALRSGKATKTLPVASKM